MPSSPTPTNAVEPITADTGPAASTDIPEFAEHSPRGRSDQSPAGPRPTDELRYSPAVLMVNVVHLLRGQGLPVSETYEHGRHAIQACDDLLRCLGVRPDLSAAGPPPEHGPVITAAAVLLRAAGIEPDAITRWPGHTP